MVRGRSRAPSPPRIHSFRDFFLDPDWTSPCIGVHWKAWCIGRNLSERGLHSLKGACVENVCLPVCVSVGVWWWCVCVSGCVQMYVCKLYGPSMIVIADRRFNIRLLYVSKICACSFAGCLCVLGVSMFVCVHCNVRVYVCKFHRQSLIMSPHPSSLNIHRRFWTLRKCTTTPISTSRISWVFFGGFISIFFWVVASVVRGCG